VLYGLVFANGDLDDGPAVQAALASPAPRMVIAADGGLRHVLALDLAPDLVIGDMDSVDPVLLTQVESRGARVKRFPVDKDDPDQLALGELRLTMAGYQVHSVDRAKALSRYLRQQARPDLLLLDVMLPDGNGFDILAQLRGRPEFSSLPIVLLTAKAELVDIRNGLALGADGYITKPYSKNQLAEVISRVLKQ
jgi:CheY-like chemotaxis protein